jgi:hypothetical protein
MHGRGDWVVSSSGLRIAAGTHVNRKAAGDLPESRTAGRLLFVPLYILGSWEDGGDDTKKSGMNQN